MAGDRYEPHREGGPPKVDPGQAGKDMTAGIFYAVAWARIMDQLVLPKGTRLKGDEVHLPDGTAFRIVPVKG